MEALFYNISLIAGQIVCYLRPQGTVMLDTAKMMGFIHTLDYQKARSFYEGQLGFPFVILDDFALVVRAGEHLIRIVKLPDFNALRSTVLGWRVEDIETVVDWLEKRGVVFEKYLCRTASVASGPRLAGTGWLGFKDPDGNVLSVSQHIPRA